MSFCNRNVIAAILVLHYFLTLISAVPGGDPQKFLNEVECIRTNSKAINCVRTLILNWEKHEVVIDYLKDYYFSLFYNLNTENIEDPLKFCLGKDHRCLEFLKPFGDSSSTAAVHALYHTKARLIVFQSEKYKTIMKEACKRESKIQETFKRLFGDQYGITFNPIDIQNDYIMHIMDKIKLTNKQKSPLKFCKDKFNPDPDYESEPDELFELKNL